MGAKAYLSGDFKQAKAHLIAGGNPYELMKIIVDGKAQGETISFREAATMELGKVDLAAARKLYADNEGK